MFYSFMLFTLPMDLFTCLKFSLCFLINEFNNVIWSVGENVKKSCSSRLCGLSVIHTELFIEQFKRNLCILNLTFILFHS